MSRFAVLEPLRSLFYMRRLAVVLGSSVLLTGASYLLGGMPPIQAAERLTISYGLLERSITLDGLVNYANNGELDDELYVYTRYVRPEQRELLRRSLRLKSNLSNVAVAQFLYSPQGQILLRRLGQIIQPESRDNGLYAIRAALILAAGDEEGLTPLNVLRRFPTPGIRINLQKTLRLAAEFDALVTQTNRIGTRITAQTEQTLAGQTLPNPQANLTLPGPVNWQRQQIALKDRSRVAISGFARVRPVVFYLYTPKSPAILRNPAPVGQYPVAVISHGLGSDRSSFAYLAEHLASHGYVVVVPAHPGSDASQMTALLRGRAEEVSAPIEFIDRPLDIKFILDRLSADQRFDYADWNNVGVVGQSFGGYTALALAGAALNFDQLQRECTPRKQLETFNISVLLQCRAATLLKRDYQIADPRVKAIVTANAVSSLAFGQAGISQIQVPTLMIAGKADTVAPAIPEQIRPFSWLTTPDRYLVVVDRSTHFSFLAESKENPETQLPLPPEVIGPSPRTNQRYLSALSLAFFRTHLQQQSQFQPYLSAAYVRSISQAPLRMDLVRSIDATALGLSPK
ncbi:alpha/beta hydrolase [filamentous cyanobacterium LEGE 11480]|uniref:Alpha/beta hydrolase n=1 Tax=Romeriopsis navalis LEGE 11480 TaxID=2777977 RepID=A0A928VT97_9CYAN|nr:alpha/beta hydrolase [Romeriopsis navalis]MBE9032152.1 alpha/beta hydrolase [Romeriopsis navalis LEGE 11480]